MRRGFAGFVMMVAGSWLGVACGDGGSAGFEASASEEAGPGGETIGTTSEALDTDDDHAVVSTSSAYYGIAGGRSVDYIWAIDTDDHLMEMRYDSYNDGARHVEFGSWTQLDYGVRGVPTMYVYPDTTGVVGFAWGTDRNLWEYFRPSANEPIQIYNISDISGFGAISGSPVIVDYGDDSSQWAISVAVRNDDDGKLYTLDYTTAMGWSSHLVLNGSSSIKSSHTIQSINRYTGDTFDDPYFAGRGLTSSDTTTSWVVHRPHGQFGSSFTKYTDFTGAGSSPYTFNGGGFVNDHNVVVARFGRQLKWAEVVQGSLAWNLIANCDVVGSPGYNAIRGYNNHLLTFSFTNGCSDEGELLTSPPWGWAYTDFLEIFRGNNGLLYAHEYGTHNKWRLDLPVP